MENEYQQPPSADGFNIKCFHCGSQFFNKYENGEGIVVRMCEVCIKEEHNEPQAVCSVCRQIYFRKVRDWYKSLS